MHGSHGAYCLARGSVSLDDNRIHQADADDHHPEGHAVKAAQIRADGVITEKGAESGKVVRAGQTILVLARQDGRDAVFDMPAGVIRDGLGARQDVEVWLADDPTVKTTGHIREISPQADPATRTYRVKVGLVGPPAGDVPWNDGGGAHDLACRRTD
ncbi:HlyD family efflux transporter periplasmic adaptor subunit [bacterium]|nr:HlyD family efflux transporter periplasmic adaptor subunit [bacterium]